MKIASMTPRIPRGKMIGNKPVDRPLSAADHF
jgi:hypothetical protein